MITPSALPPDATEAERLLAAQAVIAVMRKHRKTRISDKPMRAEAPAPVPIETPSLALSTSRAAPQSYSAATPVELTQRIDSSASIIPASTSETTAGFGWTSGLTVLGLAAVFGIGGFIAGRFTAPSVPTTLIAGANHVQAEQTPQQLLKQNHLLENQVATLQVETTTLQQELLALELQVIASKSSEPSVTGTEPGASHEEDNLTAASPTSNANIDANAFTTDGFESDVLPAVLLAFDRSLEALTNIEASYEKGMINYADREKSRRQVREQLIGNIGLQAFLAGQHALGAPNRLLVTGVAPSDFEVPVEPGDVLLSIDGQRVVDLEQLRWVENDMLDRADDAGISGDNHVLEVLRNGERLAIAYDLPLEILLLNQDSVNPSLLE